jgi:hypothetical protein
MTRTTSGQAKLVDGYVVIEFGVLHDETPGEWAVETVTLDVDAYALQLARDLLIAISDQETEADL